jgi:hypothetical protein
MAVPLLLENLRNDLAFVERQIADHPDPYDTVRLMWEQRRQALQEEIASAEGTTETTAAVALLFDGGPVLGSRDIRLDFATKALDAYQSVLGSLVAQRAGSILGQRGRLPRSFTSKLFISDMLRGSVGFLLEEPQQQFELVDTILKEAVEETMSILQDLSLGESEKFETTMSHLTPRTISAVKKMAKVLHDANAETKIVEQGRQLVLTHQGTALMNSRLTEVEITERRIQIEGMLLGLFPERQQYEFRPAMNRQVFYGPVSETFDARYIGDPDFARSILLQPVIATFTIGTSVRAGLAMSEEYVLEDVQLISAGNDLHRLPLP